MKQTALKKRFARSSASSPSPDGFIYSPAYYAQRDQIGLSRNDNSFATDRSVAMQTQRFSKERAEQAATLVDEHIDRMFSSAIPRLVPRRP